MPCKSDTCAPQRVGSAGATSGRSLDAPLRPPVQFRAPPQTAPGPGVWTAVASVRPVGPRGGRRPSGMGRDLQANGSPPGKRTGSPPPGQDSVRGGRGPSNVFTSRCPGLGLCNLPDDLKSTHSGTSTTRILRDEAGGTRGACERPRVQGCYKPARFREPHFQRAAAAPLQLPELPGPSLEL